MKRLTLRARLTLVYGGLFLLAGAVMLAVTYVLLAQQLPRPGTFVKTGAVGDATFQSSVPTQPPFIAGGGNRITATEFRSEALQQTLIQGGIALLLVGLATIALSWLIAGRTLQPIHRITETARRIGGTRDGAARGLHERIALDGPRDEVRELAETFDAMLERLDQSFDGQRRFVANASHELRTPLAINRALVEVAITRPGAPAEVRQLGEALLAVNGRHERLIDGLLTLADSENEVSERSPVDLADVAGHVLETASSAVQDAGLTLREPALEPAATAGDPVLLERLVHNIVENAVRHNAPGGWVAVESGSHNGSVTLTVTNTGPVIPRYEVETLFQPFRRRSGERTGGLDRGFGLGLSIVRAVARAHGGSVAATPRAAEEGGGLVVSVDLPAVTAGARRTPAAAPRTRPPAPQE
jgi:signal transduction histidine kinase